MTVEQLVGVVARLIKDNNLREKLEEDTLGVLRKCGAHLEAPDEKSFAVDLATAVKVRWLRVAPPKL